jgi:hypothetical protein
MIFVMAQHITCTRIITRNVSSFIVVPIKCHMAGVEADQMIVATAVGIMAIVTGIFIMGIMPIETVIGTVNIRGVRMALET